MKIYNLTHKTISHKYIDITDDYTKMYNSLNISKKWNFVIDNMKFEDEWCCFKHDNIDIDSSIDVIEYKLNNVKADIVGILGTMSLDMSGEFTSGINLFGVGKSYQKELNKDGKVKIPEHKQLVLLWNGQHDDVAALANNLLFIRKNVFVDKIRFDEKLNDFHFAENDFCLSALSKGHKLGIIDIDTSVGNKEEFGGPKYESQRKYLVDKWTKKIDIWPITANTKFNQN